MRRLLACVLAALLAGAVTTAFAAANKPKPVPLPKQVSSALRLAKSAKSRANAALKQAKTSVTPGDVGFAGDPGPPGPDGPPGAPGATGAAGASFVTGDLPSKATITGVWGGRLHRPGTAPTEVVLTVGFPRPAPVTIGDENVGFPAGTPNVANAEQLPTKCTGTIDQPTAAPGFVCLYLDPTSTINLQGSTAISGKALDSSLSDADRYGFTVHIITKDPPDSPTTVSRAEGTWAYTAP